MCLILIINRGYTVGDLIKRNLLMSDVLRNAEGGGDGCPPETVILGGYVLCCLGAYVVGNQG